MSTPPVDTDDMGKNQKDFLDNAPYNVEEDYQQTLNQVTSDGPIEAVDTSVNDGFVKDAPDLPFKLPLGLDKIFRFGRRKGARHG